MLIQIQKAVLEYTDEQAPRADTPFLRQIIRAMNTLKRPPHKAKQDNQQQAFVKK